MWCTADRRLVRHDSTCLFQQSIPAMPFVKSKHPLATRSLRSLTGTVRSLHHLIMVASCLQKIESWYPRFGLQDIDCDLGCFVLCDCWKSMKNCRDSSLSLRGLEARLPAFKLPMFAKCDALPKQIKESMPAILFGNFKHPVPTLHYACVMPIPSLQLKKKSSLVQRSRGLGHRVRYVTVTPRPLVVASCQVPRSNEQLSRFSFWPGLETGLPAFQLPMFSECDALPKGDLWDMFV